MFCAPEGFYLGEADGEQAEARDTAVFIWRQKSY